MKKLVVNILCSTGTALVLLAGIATMYGGRFLYISSVYECLLVNILIHVGLLLIHRLESFYVMLELIRDIGYTIGVVLAAGVIFDWYSSTPMWTLVLLAVFTYLFAILLNVLKIRQDVNEINQLLKNRTKTN